MTPQTPNVIFLLVGVFFVRGLALAVVAQLLWSRRKNNRRGFPVEPPDRHA